MHPRTSTDGQRVLCQTSTVHFGHFGRLSVLLVSHHLTLPLLQALHLACLQLGQVLLLHVHTAELGTKGIVGNVLLLLGLKWLKKKKKSINSKIFYTIFITLKMFFFFLE